MIAQPAVVAQATPKPPQPVLVGFPTYPPRHARHKAASAPTEQPAPQQQTEPPGASQTMPASQHTMRPEDYPPGPVEPIPAPSSDYPYRFVPSQPASLATGAPQIFAVFLNSKSLVSHGPIAIRVVTSGNVVKLETNSNGQTGNVPKIRPGIFEAKSTLPAIPFIAAGVTTTLDFVATSASGKKVTVGVPVQLK